MDCVVGIDEVGRGSWAGPLLVVAARAIKALPVGLTDSKKLTKKRREFLTLQIVETCRLGEGWVQPEEIDRIGLARGLRLGVSRALMALKVGLDTEIVIDGLINYCPAEFTNVRAIVRADGTHPIVSAASIYAKVRRDQHMARLAKFYPEYKFEKHVGYGTPWHKKMIELHGPCAIHRKSYKPVQILL